MARRRHQRRRRPNGTPSPRPTWQRRLPAARRQTPPAAPTGLGATPGNNLVSLDLERQQRIRPGRLPRLPRHQPARRHDRQRPRRRRAHHGHQLHRPDRRQRHEPTTTWSSPSTRAANRSAGSAPASVTPTVAAGAALAVRRHQRLRHLRRGASLGVTNFTLETWFKRDRRGRRRDHRHGRHHKRHPARRPRVGAEAGDARPTST